MEKSTADYLWGGVITLALVVGAVVGVYVLRTPLRDWYRQWQQQPIPTAVSYQVINQNTNTAVTAADESNSEPATMNNNADTNSADAENTNNADTTITPPAELNLAIPFTAQAPYANWDATHEEACEEASILMAARFLQGRPITDATDAEQAILQLVDYNANTMHQSVDTTAEQTAALVESFYGVRTEVIYDWSWDDVKQALAQGYPVIVPAAGRELGNPNFTAPGPLYHMFVIKGYTPDIVITNDPGTRHGADYQYSYETLYNANHDWNGGDVTTGRKVIIIVKPPAP